MTTRSFPPSSRRKPGSILILNGPKKSKWVPAFAGTTVSFCIALACALAQPWADVVLSGATTATQLESNLAASSIEVPDDTVNALRAMAMGSADYWRERSALPWN